MQMFGLCKHKISTALVHICICSEKIQKLIPAMGDGDESWSGADSSDDTSFDEPETSDTDEDIKYTTHPTRGVRWRIGELILLAVF